MILLKACPRCGGDVDATWSDDVYCIQCSHRPVAPFLAPRFVDDGPGLPSAAEDSPSRAATVSLSTARPAAPKLEDTCPRCKSVNLVRLDKLREHDNACYRCRSCGHIFSPGLSEALTQHREQTL